MAPIGTIDTMSWFHQNVSYPDLARVHARTIPPDGSTPGKGGAPTLRRGSYQWGKEFRPEADGCVAARRWQDGDPQRSGYLGLPDDGGGSSSAPRRRGS